MLYQADNVTVDNLCELVIQKAQLTRMCRSTHH